MALGHVDKIYHADVISFFFQQVARITEKFAFRIKAHKRCVGVHDVGLSKEAGLT